MINPDPIILGALIGVGGAIIGALLVGILTYCSSKKLVQQTHKNALDAIQITEFNKAAATFRAAFVNEIFMLRKNIIDGKKHTEEIIGDEVLIAHEKAKIIFEPFLCSTVLPIFNSAWEGYINYENKFDKPYGFGNTEHRKELSIICLNQINHLLSFGSPKI
jgi:hypothetical protein